MPAVSVLCDRDVESKQSKCTKQTIKCLAVQFLASRGDQQTTDDDVTLNLCMVHTKNFTSRIPHHAIRALCCAHNIAATMSYWFICFPNIIDKSPTLFGSDNEENNFKEPFDSQRSYLWTQDEIINWIMLRSLLGWIEELKRANKLAHGLPIPTEWIEGNYWCHLSYLECLKPSSVNTLY